MRAEMTMGLDLESLENLRIFNGYESEKKERRLSFEAPSSPDDNNESDTGLLDDKSTKGKSRGKSKCGRPANPIPRHKRDSHIKAEYKRRDKIQKGFDTLLTLVPELNGMSEKESKAKMLFKTADYCRRIKSECGSTQTELTALRQELESLGTEIQVLQDQLPQHGVETVKKCHDVSMDTLYDQYVEEETQKNWKFWIFGFFMRPLYDSFKQKTSGRKDSQEFNSSVFDWVQSCLSLANLRKGFLDALRKISKQTSIMNNPEQLPQEARSKVTDHCVNVKKETIPIMLTPPTTPRARTPAPSSSATCTPAPTPSPTPPRTPTVSRRLSKREIQRSTESRSRSNSPAVEETKPKRRSNYRSRSGRRSGEEDKKKMDYATTVANTNLPLLSQLLTSPQLAKTSLFGAVTMETASGSGCMTTSLQKSTPVTSETRHKMTTNNDTLITDFVESLISSMAAKSEPASPFTTAQSSSVFFSPSVATGLANNETLTLTPSMYTSSGSDPMKMEILDSVASAGSFIPLNTSGIISNGSLILPEELLTNELNTNLFETTEISEFQPMDLFTSLSNSGSVLTELSSLSNPVSQQTSQGVFTSSLSSPILHSTVDMGRCVHSQVMNTDEDSLMSQLSLDVMDVNCVMNFLSGNKSSIS